MGRPRCPRGCGWQRLLLALAGGPERLRERRLLLGSTSEAARRLETVLPGVQWPSTPRRSNSRLHARPPASASRSRSAASASRSSTTSSTRRSSQRRHAQLHGHDPQAARLEYNRNLKRWSAPAPAPRRCSPACSGSPSATASLRDLPHQRARAQAEPRRLPGGARGCCTAALASDLQDPHGTDEEIDDEWDDDALAQIDAAVAAHAAAPRRPPPPPRRGRRSRRSSSGESRRTRPRPCAGARRRARRPWRGGRERAPHAGAAAADRGE